MSNDTIKTACEQRKFNMLFNIPPVRNEVVSPYPAYTKNQLDMRRKTEILKYNKQSTQSRSLTKKEKQAQILKGNYRGTSLYCPNDYTVVAKTSSCDVPGPIIELVEDKTVPLYNYLPKRFANALEASDNLDEWSFYISSNVNCPSGLDNITNIATLLIRKAIKQELYTYTYINPIIFVISGNNIPINSTGIVVSIDVNNIDSNIYYGDSNIANDTSSISFENTTMEINLQPSNDITTDTYNYSASIYVGYMTISNIYLNTSPGFSYNIGITYNASKSLNYSNLDDDTSFDISTDTTTILNNTSFSIVANVNDEYTIEDSINCTINTNSSSSEKTITFSGI